MTDDTILSLEQARRRRAKRARARAPSIQSGEGDVPVDTPRYISLLDVHAVLLGAQSRMLRNAIRQSIARTKSLVGEIDAALGRARERVRRCAPNEEDCG
ncbi:MAG TPA: hypothetical protein VFO61_05650 [Alphaproteobacteria bacterium]|nr:hypothetical protein [Alphaproteobacteria bacterium]